MVWPTPFCIPKAELCLKNVSNLALLYPNKRPSYVLIPKNCNAHALVADFIVYSTIIVIVIAFYSPSCLGQETAMGPFGL